jgi:ribosomal protein S18 acetylase RimI-like enzyme
MSTYTIRPAQPTDLPHLPAIERAAAQLFLATPHAFIADGDGMPLASFEHHLAHSQIWVAVQQGTAGEETIVGFAIARKLDGQAYLHEIDVHPEHGRRGLGRRLIDAVIAWARQETLPAVTLSTFREVAWNEPYYAQLGFQPLAEAELGPGLLAVRAHEVADGLDGARRVCMILPVI